MPAVVLMAATVTDTGRGFAVCLGSGYPLLSIVVLTVLVISFAAAGRIAGYVTLTEPTRVVLCSAAMGNEPAVARVREFLGDRLTYLLAGLV